MLRTRGRYRVCNLVEHRLLSHSAHADGVKPKRDWIFRASVWFKGTAFVSEGQESSRNYQELVETRDFSQVRIFPISPRQKKWSSPLLARIEVYWQYWIRTPLSLCEYPFLLPLIIVVSYLPQSGLPKPSLGIERRGMPWGTICRRRR